LTSIPSVQRDLRARVAQNPRLALRHEACAWCGLPARTFIPLLVPDPDWAGRRTMVDAPACAECYAKHAPRLVLDITARAARRLITENAIDVEAYERPRVRAPRGAAPGA
jgi:hypothetical protein